MRIENSLRLHYRMLDEDDRDFVFQLNKNPEVMRYINGGKPTSREEVVRDFMPRLNAYKDVDKGWGVWKVSVIATQESIGFILVRPMNFFLMRQALRILNSVGGFYSRAGARVMLRRLRCILKRYFLSCPNINT